MCSIPASTLKRYLLNYSKMILSMLKCCIVTRGKAFIVVEMSLAHSAKLQFDLHVCAVVISAPATAH